MFGKTNKTADVLDQENSFGHMTEYEIRFDKESICLPLTRYEELIKAEVERDILARSINAMPSYEVKEVAAIILAAMNGEPVKKPEENPPADNNGTDTDEAGTGDA